MFTKKSGEHASASVSEAKCKTQPFNETDRRPICFEGNTVSEAFNENWEDEEWERGDDFDWKDFLPIRKRRPKNNWNTLKMS